MLSRSGSEIQRSGTHKTGTAASFDYGYAAPLGTSRFGAGIRSASDDHRFLDNLFTSAPTDNAGGSILARGRPVPSVFSPYEASCPEPTIPSGPRRATDPLSSPAQLQSSYSNSSLVYKPSALRKGSTVSTEAMNNTKSKASTPEIPHEIREQASDFVRASSMRTMTQAQELQQLNHSASVIGNAAQKQTSPPPEVSQERPGFFRRMFGSSSNRAHETSSQTQSQLSRRSSIHENDQAKPRPQPSQPHIASQVRPEPKTSKSEPLPGTNPTQQTLNKKASFFRRRKKSVSGEKQPPLPPQIVNAVAAQTASASPNSLRRVMSPYLNTSSTTDAASAVEQERSRPPTSSEDDDDLAVFHSGYTPPPGASLHKALPSEPRVPEIRQPRASSEPRGDPPAPDSPRMKAKVKKARPKTLVHNSSFLADNSETDDRSRSSMVSAVSTTFGLPDDNPNVRNSPVSPLSLAVGKENQAPLGRVASKDTLSSYTVEVSPSPIHLSRSGTPESGYVEQTFLVSTPNGDAGRSQPSSGRSNRVWLQPSNERLNRKSSHSDISLPLEGVRTSPSPPPICPAQVNSEYHSATSLPIVQLEGDELHHETPTSSAPSMAGKDDPTAEDKERARSIYNGDEEFVGKALAASWLGEKSPVSKRTLTAYMGLFDFAGQNLVTAMRKLCGRLILKAETQQVDRILDTFSRRWCECNPFHGFKATGTQLIRGSPSQVFTNNVADVVHTICYSLLLLNTDLHLADIEQKMTRVQFVKNTLPTIRRVVTDAVPHAFDETVNAPHVGARPPLPWTDTASSVPTSPTLPAESEERPSIDMKRNKRLSIRPSMNRTNSEGGVPNTPTGNGPTNLLVSYVWDPDQTQRSWLFDIEHVLKSFFNSIKTEALPLHQSNPVPHVAPIQHANTLSVLPSTLRRTGSVLSKAPSESMSFRGRRGTGLDSMSSRWQSKTRSRNKAYPASTVGSSRTSFDDGNSMWSPTAGSSSWSKFSTGKATTMSVDSFGTYATQGDYKQSIGFANALSQAIIREEGTAGDGESFTHVGLLEDESLGLVGAPWAKEGILKHRHHLEGPEKKAKERSWNECFAVVEKGQLRLFSFNKAGNTKSATMRRLTKSSGAGSGRAPGSNPPVVVGGGNWLANAEQLGSFVLRHCIASTLPPPGFSKTRPHVWALSLPTGAVHLFQVGTAEIAKEFMSTANYWSARSSKEPLFGGVSNIEYGWSDNVINPALVGNPDAPPSRSGAHHSASNSLSQMPRPSMQSSLRGSLDQGFGGVRARLPGDKAAIMEWKPPAQSMMASQLMEVDQLRQLKSYVQNVEDELQKHNELRNAVMLAVSF